ncbi:MAG: electron transfer flavoprotein subunit beta/FixA family protein [Deltaproteobacteria bacterium]|nr:electron transfer flavoprotein subunit beta/FixA family protein [Deltaproteobacteria bacterium]
MPEMIACFKWVIDEAYIRRGPEGELDLSSVNYKISEYDRNAIEEAVRLREAHGGSVIPVTVAAPEAAKGVKDALSRGGDRAFFIADEAFHDLEPSQTAAVLAEVIRSRIPHDLILCGEGSGDLYAQQVGPRLAEHLEIPCISFVQKLSIEQGRLIAERKVEEGLEVVAAPLPALVTVLPDINVPRIPGVKDTLAAAKKPFVTVKRDELSGKYEAHLATLLVRATQMERQCERFGTQPEDVARFLESLRKKGAIGQKGG